MSMGHSIQACSGLGCSHKTPSLPIIIELFAYEMVGWGLQRVDRYRRRARELRIDYLSARIGGFPVDWPRFGVILESER